MSLNSSVLSNGYHAIVFTHGCHPRASTSQVAVNPPSVVVTVIVQVHGVTQVTNPVLSTVATVLSLELQFTDLSVASFGDTVAVSWYVSQTVVRLISLSSSVTPVTATVPVE